MGRLLMCLQLLFMALKNRNRDQEKHVSEVLETMNCSSWQENPVDGQQDYGNLYYQVELCNGYLLVKANGFGDMAAL